MNNKAWAKLSMVVFAAVLMIASTIHARHADTGQQSVPQQEKPATQAPGAGQPQQQSETVQILKGMSRQQMFQEMRKIEAAMGAECNFCHVNPFPNETPRKAVARLMMRDYTMGMKHKDGSALTCNDCHKGEANFLRSRPFDGAVGQKAAGLQVLKDLPRDRLTQVMTAFAKALGVECAYCHTSDFDEETPRKQIARFMMTEFSSKLVKQDGSAVSCNDCHQGHARPLAVLPFPRRPAQRPQPQPDKKPNG